MIRQEKINFVHLTKNTKQEMKKGLFITSIVCGMAFVACGPSAEEKAQAEQERLDSLEAVAQEENDAAAAAAYEAEAAAAEADSAATDSTATEEMPEESHEGHSH